MADKNLKHFVEVCDGCVQTIPSPPPHPSWPALILGADPSSYSIGNGISFDRTQLQNGLTYTTGAFVGTMQFYHGGVTDPAQEDYAFCLKDTTGNTQTYVAAYTASTGRLKWATAVYGRNGALLTQGYSVSQDQSGVYVTGYFTGSVEFYSATPPTGPPAILQHREGSGKLLTSTALSSLFLAKWDPTGRLLWATHIDNVNDILNSGALQILQFSSNQVASNGAMVFLCNYYQGTTTVYNANGTMAIQMTSISSTHQQGFLTGFNAVTGAFAWATTFNSEDTTASSVAIGLACDQNNVYVSGGFVKTMTYYNTRTTTPTLDSTFVAQGTLVTQNPSALNPAPNRSAFLAAYSASLGTHLWINQLDAFQRQAPCDAVRLSVDQSGVYLLTVFSNGVYVYPNAGSYAGAVTLTNLPLSISKNLGIVKYTHAGSVIWLNKITNFSLGSTTADYYMGASIVADHQSLAITGTMDVSPITLYEANTNDPPVEAMTLQPLNTSHVDEGIYPLTDTFVALFTANSGQLKWATILGHTGVPAAAYAVATNSSKTMIAAYGVGPIDLYSAASSLVQPTKIAKTLTASTNYYSFIATYDHNGQVI